MIRTQQRGGISARPGTLPALVHALQALLLGLLAPFSSPALAGTAPEPAGRDAVLPAPICTAMNDPLPPIVNLHDAYFVHGGRMLFGGVHSLDRFGEGLAAGDYTGDGVADLAIGMPAGSLFGGPRAGLLYPFQGSSAGPTQGRMSIYQQGDAGGNPVPGDDFGDAIAVGDFDDDGFDDVVVAAPNKIPAGKTVHAGVLFRFHSEEFFLSGQGPLVEEQAGAASAEGDEFGRALAVGDFNGDGFVDLAAGAPGRTIGGHADAGAVLIFPGSATGLGTGSVLTDAAFSQALQDGDRFGAALATGDFNGDGRTDLAVGIPGKKIGTADNAGVVGVLYGSAAGLVPGPRLAQEADLQTSEADDGFGSAIAAGDLDDDGKDDLVVGVPGEDQSGVVDAGMVCPFLGLIGTFMQRPCLFENGAGVPLETMGRFGTAVAAGDLDGDGRADVAVGVPGSALGGAVGAGALLVYASTNLGLQARQALVLEDAGGESDAGDLFGSRVVMADFDGDGTADIATAATFDAPPNETNGGSVSFFPGLSPLARLRSGPMLGAVTDTSIKVWGRSDRPASLAVEWKPAGTPWPGTIAGPVGTDEDGDLTGVVPIAGLAAASGYEYRLLLDGVVQPQSEAAFTTLATPGPGRITRFAIGADLEFGQDPYTLVPNLQARQPDFTLLIGDQIYADEPLQSEWSVFGYGKRYRENWGEALLAPFLARVPTFMIWDDHDIEDNWNSGTSLPYPYARGAFDLYQGSHNPDPRLAGEISFAFQAGDAAFYMPDVRTNRNHEDDPDTASKSMLGAMTKADLKAWLLSTPARFKFLVSPVMWSNHGTTGNDSWVAYQTERQEILDFIRTNHICGVVLISGDQHWSGVMRLDQAPPYHFYELSPTPLGNTLRTKTTDTGPDILFKDDSSQVYGFVTADSTANPARVTLEIYNSEDTRIYQRVLTWPDLCPDSDGDTFLDDVDCAPANPNAWSRPAEVTLQLLADTTTLEWTASTNAGGTGQPTYDLLVSGSPSDFSSASGVCLRSNTTVLAGIDTTVPASGEARYYLVRAENLCGGTLEVGSDGAELIGRTCP
ncbi:MAG TPA: alkaline phosphatase D family protein [Verrucomicrobiae bacterium]|nr:alkaline phosphatase D family protein [Verrucomicrobiae bacterium]